MIERINSTSRDLRQLRAFLLAGFNAVCIGFIALSVYYKFDVHSVWDDAYMFVRYASNLITDGVIAWKPNGEPTYGLTSLLFLGLVSSVRLLTDNPVLVALIASTLGGVAFVALLLWLVGRHLQVSPFIHGLCFGLVAYSLVIGSDSLGGHFTSGMDTTFALAYLTGFLLLAVLQDRSPSLYKAILLGAMGALGFAVRPDLMLYSFAVPTATVLFSGKRTARLLALLTLAVIVVGLGLQLFLAKLYFGSPLPLPFYAKGMKLYGDYIHEVYKNYPIKALAAFLVNFRYLFIVLAVDLVLDPRGWWRRKSALDKGLLGATVAFMGYHFFFTLQIMGYNQRFYYPVLPVLVWLAINSLARLLGMISEEGRRCFARLPTTLWILTALCLLASTIPTIRKIHNFGFEGQPVRNFEALQGYKKYDNTRWFRLDAFSALPDDLVMATTEVGKPVALNPGKAIIDLAGLNETLIARGGFDPKRFFERYRPDLIYMFHPHYREMIRRLESDAFFKQRYHYFPAEHIGCAMGLALLRESPYYKIMHRIVKEGLAKAGTIKTSNGLDNANRAAPRDSLL